MGRAIIVEVDENLNVKGRVEEPDEYSTAQKITPPESSYTCVNGVYCNTPDLTGFNPESTYYVTYDASGDNETIAGRIDRVEQNVNKICTNC